MDNDAARYSLIKGYSPAGVSARLVARFWEQEATLESHCWIERVPSLSNIADGPSRLSFTEVVEMGGKVIEPPREFSDDLISDELAWA